MPAVPNSRCVEYEKQGYPGFEAYHEIANAILCIVHITFISRNSALKLSYKSNLLPVVCGQFIQSICVVIVNLIPFAKCYYHSIEKPWYVMILGRTWFFIYALNRFYILHFLIRDILISKYARNGLISALVIPAVLAIIPIYTFIIDYKNAAWMRIAQFIVFYTSFANFIISIYLIFKGLMKNIYLPILIAIYEIFFAVTESMKHYVYHHFWDTDLYVFLTKADDFAFLIAAICWVPVLLWENHKKYSSEESELATFENQNVELENETAKIVGGGLELVPINQIASAYSSVMAEPECVFQGFHEFDEYHEFFNVFLCVIHILLITRIPVLRQSYKFNLLPVVIGQLIQSISTLAMCLIPSGICYYRKYHLYLRIGTTIWAFFFAGKPFYILHFLIRNVLISRYSKKGFIASFAIPILLSVIPIFSAVVLYDLNRLAHLIVSFSSIACFAIAVYVVLTGQMNSNYYPILMAIHEILFGVIETLKHIAYYHIYHWDLLELMHKADDYGFMIAALIWFPIYFWEYRQRFDDDDCELAYFENQNTKNGDDSVENNVAYY